jgi:ketosteroid isomerase-like protein
VPGLAESNLERLRELYDEWARGDFTRTDIFDPEVVNTSVGVFPEGTRRLRGKEEVLGAMNEWVRTWERPLTIEAEEFVESGDRILVVIRWRGRGKGSGAAMEAGGGHLWTFREGRAIGYDVYRDPEEARVALETGGSED